MLCGFCHKPTRVASSQLAQAIDISCLAIDAPHNRHNLSHFVAQIFFYVLHDTYSLAIAAEI
jgi:hypothetical protein